jgi:hypothetical protein
MAPRVDTVIARPAPPTAEVPTQPIDVTTVDPKSAEFRALPPKYRTAVREAKAYYQKNFSQMAPPPRVLVTASKSNGDLPVTVIVPPGVQPPLTVHTHYHGDRAGSVSGENAAADRVAERVRGGSRTVYVMPEAAKTGEPTSWHNVTSINKTTAEALDAVGLRGQAIERNVISGHSAGGRAISRDLSLGNKLRADELVLQDALYDGKQESAYKPILAKLPGADVKKVTLVHSDQEGMSHPRGETLARELEARGIQVAQRRVAVHPQAAGVLEDSPPVRSIDEDRYEPSRPRGQPVRR